MLGLFNDNFLLDSEILKFTKYVINLGHVDQPTQEYRNAVFLHSNREVTPTKTSW